MLKIRIMRRKTKDKAFPLPSSLFHPRNGFTLVELLIATSLVGMIALAVLSAFGTGFYAFGRVQSFAGAQADILLALDRWERDVNNSFSSSVIGFKGDSRSISFPSVITIFDEEKQEEAVSLGEIYYYLDDRKKAFITAQKDYARPASVDGEEPPAETLAYVEDLRFSYYFYKTEIQEGEEEISHGWKSSWTQEDEGIPRGVKVELTFRKEGKDVPLARTVFIPVGGSILEAEEESGEGEGGTGEGV